MTRRRLLPDHPSADETAASKINRRRDVPRKGQASCYAFDDKRGRMDNHLHVFLGQEGFARLLSYIDMGRVLFPDGDSACRVEDFSAWAEVFRRLHVPYYEEARRYFKRALQDGFYDDPNEIWPMTQEGLLLLIKEYRKE